MTNGILINNHFHMLVADDEATPCSRCSINLGCNDDEIMCALFGADQHFEIRNIEEVSDGYHTFAELYDYIILYNAAFANELAKNGEIEVYKTHKHSDGVPCFNGGWFAVVIELPTGQITNHYENKYWDLFHCSEKDKADYYDGHTSQEAAMRLQNFLTQDNHGSNR